MRALVLSGGSSKLAYSVGCLQYLMGELHINYDAYVGVSAGAINSAFLAQFKSGEETLASESLKKLWLSLDNSKIYKHWKPFKFLHAITKNALYDSSPMHSLVRANLDINKIRSSGKIVEVGATSLSSGKYTMFDGYNKNFIDSVLASAAFPVAFEAVMIDDHLWSDGGLKSISPLKAAIDLGATEIDLIVTHPQTRIKKFIINPNIFDIFIRSLDLATDKIMYNDIEKLEMYNELAKAGLCNKKFVKLNIIQPGTNLIENLLDFSPGKIQEMLKRGYDDAKVQYIK